MTKCRPSRRAGLRQPLLMCSRCLTPVRARMEHKASFKGSLGEALPIAVFCLLYCAPRSCWSHALLL